MLFNGIFPRLLGTCMVLALCATTAAAQSDDTTLPRHTTTSTEINGVTRLENDPVIISLAPVTEPESVNPLKKPITSGREFFQGMMLSAIEARLGTPYRLGTSGPHRYDCSGFVWSVFRSAGLNFERTNARSLWGRFAPARGDERYQFGTLVFFNNLGHVGIVADGHGFYHASTSKGVVYSSFNDYWTSRIDGFRRVAVADEELAAAGE
ncbi:MAG: C40 family peptidase [Pyrinomonadaceae bacterium]